MPGSEHIACRPLPGGAASGSLRDFVIPLPQKLNKTEPVTERIRDSSSDLILWRPTMRSSGALPSV
jgi:hypothetical protein